MKRLIAFSCLVIVLILSVSIAFAIQVKTTMAPRPQVEEEVNGSYEIAVKTPEGWQMLGSPGFGKWPSNKVFELGQLPVTKNGQVVIRLTQRGGGAAHIDAVKLGGSPPISVTGGAANAKLKLFKRDHDLLEATKKTLTLTFPASNNGKLEITARVEPTEISKMPFTFPRQDVTSGEALPREFFAYMPGTKAGKLVADGLVDKGVAGKPFFRTFSATASGHPPTFTTGWVMDDGKKHWYEVILVDPSHPAIKKDAKMGWISKVVPDRAGRGKTPAGKKGRGQGKKGTGREKMRPSLRAKGRTGK